MKLHPVVFTAEKQTLWGWTTNSKTTSGLVRWIETRTSVSWYIIGFCLGVKEVFSEGGSPILFTSMKQTANYHKGQRTIFHKTIKFEGIIPPTSKTTTHSCPFTDSSSSSSMWVFWSKCIRGDKQNYSNSIHTYQIKLAYFIKCSNANCKGLCDHGHR